jgi:hypothetical protein
METFLGFISFGSLFAIACARAMRSFYMFDQAYLARGGTCARAQGRK